MATIWIIHRDEGGRTALARGVDSAIVVLGAPGDDLFHSAGAPDAVVLGLAGDFEAELEFVHRVSPRLRGCPWILVPEPASVDEMRRLFDTLPYQIVPFPPQPRALRRALRAALQGRPADSLSRRLRRDQLAARFGLWLGDIDAPELLRALDPGLARVPLLIRGEPGTGRGLLARYVHAFGGPPDRAGSGTLIQVPCRGAVAAGSLLAPLRAAAADAAYSIWLEDVDTLAPRLQQQVRDWVEFGPPEGALRAPLVRWFATAGEEFASASASDWSGDHELEPGLAYALSGLTVCIPPLRERSGAIERLAVNAALRWSTAHDQTFRHLSEDCIQALRDHPWPGNLAELEAVVAQTLASTGADPVRAIHLRFSGGGGAPAEPGENEPAREIAPARPATATIEPPPEPLEPAPASDSPKSESVPDRGAAPSGEAWRRLVGAVAHEIRNPLVSIRTFVELLPERLDDPEFREGFARTVGDDVRRIEQVVTQLQEMTGDAPAEAKPVDVAALLETLLDEQRNQIRARHLLVLRELDRDAPHAMGDPDSLRSTFAGLLERALALVPERGDLYIASRHHESGLRGGPSLRVLLRYSASASEAAPDARSAPIPELSPSAVALEFSLAEATVRSQGGTLTLDTSDPRESVVVIDLPAPRA
ncbi:MAG: hypothetical protein O7A09_09735 [Proteobacteria bacterium]|nr:hypothetical protein [Pseudomonadota bacterium]